MDSKRPPLFDSTPALTSLYQSASNPSGSMPSGFFHIVNSLYPYAIEKPLPFGIAKSQILPLIEGMPLDPVPDEPLRMRIDPSRVEWDFSKPLKALKKHPLTSGKVELPQPTAGSSDVAAAAAQNTGSGSGSGSVSVSGSGSGLGSGSAFGSHMGPAGLAATGKKTVVRGVKREGENAATDNAARAAKVPKTISSPGFAQPASKK
eukprot:ANDGO_03405.mRNA.1 hypothetical protein